MTDNSMPMTPGYYWATRKQFFASQDVKRCKTTFVGAAGECLACGSTRRCLVRGGWTPGDASGYSKATCEALETCRVLETLEAQLGGHALTAKEATANLLRASASEAAREAAEAKAARLKEALVAQRAFILHWTDDVNGGLKPTLGSLRSALDAARAALEA